MSLHKNIPSTKKLNSVTLPSETFLKASSQFLAYKHLRPGSNKKKYDILMINKPCKSINTNNYIINTLNVSEKNFTNNSTAISKDLNKYKKEKEELNIKIKEQKTYIEKLIEKNKKLDKKFNEINEQNLNYKKQFSVLKENQDQLIMLIKIIQENGVDIDALIDKWNSEIEAEEKKESNRTIDTKMNREHQKYEFLPITVDNGKKNKGVIVKGVPKLNFDAIRKKNEEK